MNSLTVIQLQQVMPTVSNAAAESFIGPLNAAMNEVSITTPLRVAAFVAQLAHESGELRYWEELSDGSAYEGRRDLGNDRPGDGPRFKGRGPIQLTGRLNYRRAGNALGLDLEGHPEIAATIEVGFRIAGWYWSSHSLNAFADIGDIITITRKINGGLNGLARRVAYYERAKAALKEAA